MRGLPRLAILMSAAWILGSGWILLLATTEPAHVSHNEIDERVELQSASFLGRPLGISYVIHVGDLRRVDEVELSDDEPILDLGSHVLTLQHLDPAYRVREARASLDWDAAYQNKTFSFLVVSFVLGPPGLGAIVLGLRSRVRRRWAVVVFLPAFTLSADNLFRW